MMWGLRVTFTVVPPFSTPTQQFFRAPPSPMSSAGHELRWSEAMAIQAPVSTVLRRTLFTTKWLDPPR
jgi:hypothetical protein